MSILVGTVVVKKIVNLSTKRFFCQPLLKMLEDDEERRHDDEQAGGADEHSAYGAYAY